MDYIREFTRKIQDLDRSKSIQTVFRDFLSLGTYSLAQPFYRSPDIEQKYKLIVKDYTKEQTVEFSKLFAFLVQGLEEQYQDFLGQIFMELGFGNAKKGQFFTPYSVSKLMAEINFSDFEKKLNEKDFVTLSEPCCGSGGIIITLAEIMKNKGYNYQHQLFVEAIDIDEICFKMAYIQLSLLGIPARVIRGDTLAMRFYEVLYTPFYFLGNFEYKLKRHQQEKSLSEKEYPKLENATQLTLFNYL